MKINYILLFCFLIAPPSLADSVKIDVAVEIVEIIDVDSCISSTSADCEKLMLLSQKAAEDGKIITHQIGGSVYEIDADGVIMRIN